MATLAKDWWKNAVVYQIYIKSFCDSNGDGIGDIPGIISKLHYLKDLGVDVIWLSPVFLSPNFDNGYDVSDFKSIQPEFGNLEDMDRLIAKAKRLGIRIVLDMVVSCISKQHEWFQRALAGEEKYKNYFHILETDKKKPNNWSSFHGGSVWSPFDDKSYYLHLMDEGRPDLNWHNIDVYNEYCDIFKFWIDRGIAGFRLCLSNIIYKDSFEDGASRVYLTGHEHYVNTEGNHDILHRLYNDVFKGKCFVFGEMILEDIDDVKFFCDPEREELNLVYTIKELDTIFNSFKVLTRKFSAKKYIENIDSWQKSMDWSMSFFENHDHIRSVNMLGNVSSYWAESAKLIGGLTMCLRGTPFIFEGQELGMTNGDFSRIRELRDITSKSNDRKLRKMYMPLRLRRKLIIGNSRDNARTPMQWDNSEYAGFSDVEPWIKVNQNKEMINVEIELQDENSILNFYRKIIDIRKNSDALSSGTYRRVASDADVLIFTREGASDRMYVYANLTPFYRAVEFYGETIVIDNYGEDKLDKTCLLPYEFRVIKARV